VVAAADTGGQGTGRGSSGDVGSINESSFGGGGGGGGSYLSPELTDTFAVGGTVSGNGEVIIAEVLCFLHGTRILTPTGAVPVEELGIGGTVVSRFSGIRRIKWIGRQSFAPHFIAPEKFPVRIAAGALEDGVPARDLLVSPGHSILLDNILVLTSKLINDATITQIRPESDVNYIQLDFGSHDCVVAEGAWSETYADAPCMRAQFHNAAEYEALYPDEPPCEALVLCAPRPEAGRRLEAALAAIQEKTKEARTSFCEQKEAKKLY
jgi:hypothetical protein